MPVFRGEGMTQDQHRAQAGARHVAVADARLRLREKIGYGIGDFGFNLYWANISAFLLIFYTDVMGLAAGAVGTMMLVTKLVDAVADPFMGALADRTRTRWGRFRPWMLWGILPLAVTGVLTWTVPDLDGGGRLLTFAAAHIGVVGVVECAGVAVADSRAPLPLLRHRSGSLSLGDSVADAVHSAGEINHVVVERHAAIDLRLELEAMLQCQGDDVVIGQRFGVGGHDGYSSTSEANCQHKRASCLAARPSSLLSFSMS